jgi:hypothetical protein
MAMIHCFADPAVILTTWSNGAFLPQVFKQRYQIFLHGDGHFFGVFESLLFD